MPDLSGYVEKFAGKSSPSSSKPRKFSFSLSAPSAKWEKKFFVLRDGSQVLSYHKTADDATSNAKPAQGTVLCSGGTVCADAKNGTTFSITHAEKVVYLRAKDESERRRWIDACVEAGCEEASTAEEGPSISSTGVASGLILKQNKKTFGSSSWDSRYLVVKDGAASVYKSEAEASGGKAKPALVSVGLAGSRIDVVKGEGGADVVFVLSKADKVHTFKAGNGGDATTWMKAMAKEGAECPSLPAEATGKAPEAAGGGDKKKATKRMAVSAETGGGSNEEYVKKFYKKTDEAREFIFSAIADSALFAGCQQAQREELVDAMRPIDAKVGDAVITQGEEGNDYYVVRSGEYTVHIEKLGETPVHTYYPGGSFGELALLYNKPRAASIKCKEAGMLYGLDRGTFRGVLQVPPTPTLTPTLTFTLALTLNPNPDPGPDSNLPRRAAELDQVGARQEHRHAQGRAAPRGAHARAAAGAVLDPDRGERGGRGGPR